MKTLGLLMEREMWKIVPMLDLYDGRFKILDDCYSIAKASTQNLCLKGIRTNRGVLMPALDSDYARNVALINTDDYPLSVLAYRFWYKLRKIARQDLWCVVQLLHWLGIMKTPSFERVSWKSFFWWIEVKTPSR